MISGSWTIPARVISSTVSRVHPMSTGVIRNQGHTPSWDPTVSLCLGTYGGLRWVGVSYERGTPVRYPCDFRVLDDPGSGHELDCIRGAPYEYRGHSKSMTHTVVGPYGRSIRTFLRAVRCNLTRVKSACRKRAVDCIRGAPYRGTSLIRSRPPL